MKRKLTPKQRVLKKYRKAFVLSWRDHSRNKWYGAIVYPGLSATPGRIIGQGIHPTAAWADAARRMK